MPPTRPTRHEELWSKGPAGCGVISAGFEEVQNQNTVMKWEFLCQVNLKGQTADVITPAEVVHAVPGTDVTLMCVFPKLLTTHIIQTQWSKIDGSPSTKIAVYHPTYGTHYFKFSEAPYKFSVSFSTRRCCSGDDTVSLCSTNPNATSECNWWALHLKNVTVSLSGKYECAFATYPYGTKAAKIQLTVKAEGK
ncbi:hypothetical protein DUI87_11091 [Hirundo rustica rustica]|uniref:Immunoglobulin domain-containing protein n=1 Tax=Hirundo rustica rustica TaxID=333673 RepID=A0A3M0KH76_HIRRU|nr:hypothetical protein DUI87_11091 [Hirundo rustica rustica]